MKSPISNNKSQSLFKNLGFWYLPARTELYIRAGFLEFNFQTLNNKLKSRKVYTEFVLLRQLAEAGWRKETQFNRITEVYLPRLKAPNELLMSMD